MHQHSISPSARPDIYIFMGQYSSFVQLVKVYKVLFHVLSVFLQIVSETLPDLADLLPPSSSDVSLGLHTATAVDELLKLIT